MTLWKVYIKILFSGGLIYVVNKVFLARKIQERHFLIFMLDKRIKDMGLMYLELSKNITNHVANCKHLQREGIVMQTRNFLFFKKK